MISRDSIEQLKERVEIVDLISNYLELRKAGANYKAKCPFHSEKTSSFVVSPSKGIFHCFGCGVGGDAIKFVMEMEKLNYPEAIEKIAFIYNFPLRYERNQNLGGYSKISKLLERIQKWYRENLDSNQEANRYLKDRGVTQALIESFGIGYAPKSGLIEFLQKNHIPIPQAVEAGVVQEGESGGFYARLVDRVTFPIYSPSGLIVGFGGRTVGSHPAKYINSPQTKLFNKSKLLYGYHKAKESIFKQKEMIVCEGYFDVIMLHKVGFKRAVATLGTALTAEHLPLLKKSDAKIVLAYDGDRAGVEAGVKASKLLAQNGFDGGVALLREGFDPADMVVNGRVEELDIVFRDAKELTLFVLEQIVKKFDISTPIGKERAFREINRFLKSLSPIRRDSSISKASLILNLPEAYFRSDRDESITFDFDGTLQKKNPAWEQILKSVIENKRLLNELLDIFSPDMVEGYGEAIEFLIRGEFNSKILLSIAVDENIEPLSEENFKKALLTQLEIFYLRKLNRIKRDTKIPYKHKSYWFRKIRTDIIPRIKRGELVVLNESGIPI
jgi:DNA primase